MEAFRKLAILMLVLATVLGCEMMGSNAVICNMDEQGLMSCKPAVTGPKPTKPSPLCCSTLSHADMACLCKLKDLLPSLGIDPKRAYQLPKKCKLPLKVTC